MVDVVAFLKTIATESGLSYCIEEVHSVAYISDLMGDSILVIKYNS